MKYFVWEQIRRSCQSFSPRGESDVGAGGYTIRADIVKMLRFIRKKKRKERRHNLRVFFNNGFSVSVLLSL